jgi:hypothetical protein
MWPTLNRLRLALCGKSPSRPGLRRPASRLHLEALEDRTVPSVSPYLPVTAGLVSGYSFDSAFVDDVGLNNPSAVSGATRVPSKVGNGLTLAPGGYVDIADNGTLDNQTFTVSSWVRPLGPDTNDDSFGGVILSKNVNGSQSSLELAWSAATGQFNAFCNTTLMHSQHTFAPGPFYHVAVTCDGTTLQLYVNGALEGQQSGIGSVVYDTADPWTIGSEGPQFGIRPGRSRTFNGVLDEAYFYDRVLSGVEIGSIVAAAPANAPPSAKAGGPYVLAAGGSVTLDASASSDPDNDPLTYSWTVNGHAGAAVGVNPTLSWSALQALGVSAGQTYPVSVTVDDGHGHAVPSAANAVLWAAVQLPALPVTAGLVSSYSFDSAIVDDVGLNNPSAVSGANRVPGEVNTGLSLSVASGGHVDIPDNGTLDNQVFTMMAWARDDDTPGPNNDDIGNVIVTKDLTSETVSVGLYARRDGRFVFLFGDIGHQDYIVSNDSFALGQFHHVAGTYDGSTFKLYVDGVLERQAALSRTIPYSASEPWTIGSEAAGGSPRTFNGVIDQVGLYDRALSATEIAAFVPRSSLSGIVFEDFNNDGQVDFGERAIAGVTVTLTGTDDLGNAVGPLPQQTDTDGNYRFDKLRPGAYYLTQTQPAGYLQGIDSVGSAGGSLVATDQFFVQLGEGIDGINYNYGERPQAGGAVQPGQTAGIGFWHNNKGQALIRALNGGSSSTELADWLATTLPHMYGSQAGAHSLIHADNSHFSNTEVAAFYQSLFNQSGPKLDAQVLATALSVYVTNATLDPTLAAASYGFTVSGDGAGTATVNVGSNGDAFGVSNNTTLTVMDLLLATDAQTVNGVLYNGNATKRSHANSVYSAVNQAGDIS